MLKIYFTYFRVPVSKYIKWFVTQSSFIQNSIHQLFNTFSLSYLHYGCTTIMQHDSTQIYIFGMFQEFL